MTLYYGIKRGKREKYISYSVENKVYFYGWLVFTV